MFATGKRYIIIFFSILVMLPGISSFAQDYPEYEEIALFLDVPNLGGTEIDVLIKGNDIYLPITDFFDFLMIRNVPTPGLDSISGFFINQYATYLIDREKNLIHYGDELYELKPGDLIRTETNLFLRGQYYGQIFGLECEFSFRNMSVRVNTNLELPAIREMRQQAMRKNMNRLVGEIEADTSIGRTYPFFHFGMADWSVNITERMKGPSDTRLNLALGAMIAGGEATVSLNYNSHTEFTEKQQYYLWRYVNNDNKALRQVMAGKIATGATASIYDPVVGVQFTNSSTKFKRSFGTYTLSDRTEPNWIVELYVNNELIDYTTADASGFFTFQVPMVYGNTSVRLKFYGPWGEERVREKNITVPFSFVPKKTLEYKVSAGMIQDNLHSKFSRAQVNYGLFRSMTIGTGVEYISSLTTGQLMPFVNGSFRLASNLLLSGEYSPEVRSKGTLTYRLPSSLQFDINYIYYTEGQQAINNNFREERKISMSLPIRFKNVSVYNRFTVNQLVLPTSNYTTSEWLISGALFGVSTNITSYAIFIGNTKPYFYSDFSMSFRLPHSISIQPRAQYSYTNKKLLSTKVLAEKRVLKKAYLTASYERNFQSKMNLFEVGFRYDFKFAQTSFLTRKINDNATFVQFARGSIINDGQTNYVTTDNRGNVGKGGISILAYLDKNANGMRDEGEPRAYGLNIRANSGRIEKREQDTTIRIFGLEPYTDCFIEFDQSSFDNIAWRLNYKSISIAVDPNMIKLVEVPISVVGEAAGMIRIDKGDVVRGIGRVIVNFYNEDQKIIGRTLSESDGYFSYFGLNPGNYDVKLDTNQLQKLGMIASPGSINFDIAAILDGDYVDGLDFIIKQDTSIKPKKPVKKAEPLDMLVYIESELDLDNTQDEIVIKLGSYNTESEAEKLQEELSTLMSKEASLVFEDNKYQVRVDGFTNKHEFENYFPELQSKGINKITMLHLLSLEHQREFVNIQGSAIDTVIMYSDEDTTVLVLNQIVQKDTTTTEDSYVIELATFDNETEADTLLKQLSTIKGKQASIVFEDEQYKVHIEGLSSRDEIEDYFPIIKNKGIKAISVVSIIGKAEERSDTEMFIVHEVVKQDTTTTDDSFVIELGTFDNKIEADTLLTQLLTLKGKEPKLVFEDEQYKVHIDGLTTKEEIQDYFPMVRSKGINEISVISMRGTAEPRMATDIIGLESTFTENDSTIFVVHEVIKEDTTAIDDSFVIELAEFDSEPEANYFIKLISTIKGKEAKLVFEDDRYKVQITGLSTREETKDYFPIIKSKGINEVSVLNVKGIAEPRTPATETMVAASDTTILIVHEVIEEDLTSATDSYVIQVGAFQRRSYAKRLKNKLSGILGKEVIITEENGFYKVRITGFNSIYDLEKYIPGLVRKGYNEIWVVTLKGMQKPGSDLDNVRGETELINTFTENGTTYFIIYESVEEDRTTIVDSYAIQLGAFRNRPNAEVLKIRMNAYLGREIEIYVENGLYKVRIADFKSRKEVDEYVGELLKIGVKEIRVVGIKGIQEQHILTNRIDTIQPSDIDGTKTIIDTKRKKKITIKPVKKVVTKETEVKKKPTIVPRKEVVKTQPPVAERSSVEDRLLEAEYKTGLYEARWPGVEFVIQIAASKSISDPEVIKKKFNLYDEVNVTRSDVWYRFSVGQYIKYWQAREYRNILRTRFGIEDAIIVAYKDGKKIMFNDLLAIAEDTPLTGLTVRPALSKSFSVQVMATEDAEIRVSALRELYGVDEVIFKEYDENDGLYRYSIGNFVLYSDAAKVRNQIKLRGYKGVFVIGFKDGKRVKDLKSLLE